MGVLKTNYITYLLFKQVEMDKDPIVENEICMEN